MSMKFYSYNLVDQETTVITPSEQTALFPISNLKDIRRTKVYRSLTNSITIVFDFINPQPVDSILLADNPLTGFNFNTPVTIEANATDTWGAPAYSTTLTTKDDEHGIAYLELTLPENYRFWRLSFNSTSYVELSTLFIGKRIEFTDSGIEFGWSYQDRPNLTKSVNRYRQAFFDEINEQKNINARMRYLNKDEIDQVFEMYDYNGVTKPMFIRIDCDILNNKNRFSGYMRFKNKEPIINSAPSLYDFNFSLEEQL